MPQALAVDQPRIDIGFLAEALLFHDEVRVFANRPMIADLLRAMQPEVLIDYLVEKRISLSFVDGRLGIHTRTMPGQPGVHTPIQIHLADIDLQRILQEEIEALTERRGYSRRVSSRLINFVNLENDFADAERALRNDFSDQSYLDRSVKQVLRLHTDQPLDNIRFRLEPYDTGFIVKTNINFDSINRAQSLRAPAQLSPSFILAQLSNTREQIALTAKYAVSMASNLAEAGLLELRIERTIERSRSASEEVRRFQDLVLGDSRALGDALLNGSRSFSEFLDLLHDAEKFRSWIKKADPDAGLVTNYLDELTRKTWLERLPAKSVRWSIFLGAGVILDATVTSGLGTAIGIVVSAADQFLLDRLLAGWKPNQFVETKLEPFVKATRTAG